MSTKSKLLSKNRKIHKRVTLDVDGSPVEVLVCKPTMGDRAKVVEAAQAAGEIDEKGEMVSGAKGLRMMGRVVATVLYDPETRQRLFSDSDLDDLLDQAWLEDVFGACREVFVPDVEAISGK